MNAIYVRVSTDESAKKGYSIESQIQACEKKAGTKETMVYKDEALSGEYLERPGLTKLREDVSKGIINKVICYDPDRLSRNLMNQLIIDDEFTKRGVEMIYVSGEFEKSPDGRMFYMMRGAISEYEKAKINERMTRGRKQKAKQGKVVKNNYIYGYDYDKEKGQMVINKEEAKIVKMIFDLFTKPNNKVQGMNGIAKYLTSLGVPTKRGASQWHRQVVRQLLFNSVYMGKFAQNKWNTEGMLGNRYKTNPEDKVKMKQREEEEWIYVDVPAIVSEEQFEHAQQLLQDSRRRWAKKGLRTYLLSGLIRCGDCGNTMSGKVMNSAHSKLIYHDIKGTAGFKNRGCGNWVACADLDKVVWDQVKYMLENPDEVVTEEKTELQWEAQEIHRLESEIEKAKKGRKKLYKLASLDDDLDVEELKDEIKALQEKEMQLTKDLESLKKKVNAAPNESLTKEAIENAYKYYLNAKDALSIEDKQTIIRTIVKEIRYYRNETVEIITY